MSETKISQHTAILLEHARKCGLQAEELLQAIRSGQVEAFHVAQNGHFDYTELFSYAEQHGEDLEKAATEGYRITFNTRNGLKIWLEEAFHLSSESDFSVGEGIIEGLPLQEAQLERLKQTMAVNWTIAEVGKNEQGYNVKLTVRGLQ
ncbi:hypothetical protein MNQ98_07205 [Paenibacillus sp. N3/727]|uniref:hypothetical protein n=1 Tax=Paenibacillus sp. N3/727 TaxID=2925845 RepID=UPI001F53075B|nr:hypothetical protein [Paenibacillus sp. N3/727]UNK19809.1 hypothetical protein MNQ98_07205 [Paenibacillus sp. N3/727]